MLSVLRRWWKPQGEFSEAGQYGGGFTRCAGGAGLAGNGETTAPSGATVAAGITATGRPPNRPERPVYKDQFSGHLPEQVNALRGALREDE